MAEEISSIRPVPRVPSIEKVKLNKQNPDWNQSSKKRDSDSSGISDESTQEMPVGESIIYDKTGRRINTLPPTVNVKR